MASNKPLFAVKAGTRSKEMKNASRCVIVLLLMSLAVSACGPSAPTEAIPQVEAEASTAPAVETATVTPAPTATPTAIPVAASTPTTAKLKLEIVQSQTWTDRDGNVRVNVLVRNPYDFPVAPAARARANLLNGAGQFMRDQALYFLDGISGGNGFLLPGETVAANACFTCERTPLTEEWSSVEILSSIEDASGSWDYSTEVEATVGNVSFDGDSPIFWITGTVKNNSDSMLNRIFARVVVFDQEGNLVGAAEASAWDVGPGAAANIDGYGIGKAPDGPVNYEVTALGVKY
jgi:hypothetical protein